MIVKGSTPDQYFGWSVAILDDLTGDGYCELAIGAPGTMSRQDLVGEVHCISGRDGARIGVWHGAVGQPRFGYALCVVDDVDGDGHRDIAVGSPGYEEFERPGRVDILSVKTGKTLYSIEGDTPGDQFGTSLALVRNADGGVRNGLAIGVPANYAIESRGFIQLYSLATRAMIRETPPRSEHRVGYGLESLDDVDRDGCGDILNVEGDTAVVFSGRDGHQVAEFSYPGFAHRAAMPPRPFDYDRDGWPDLVVVCEHETSPSDTGLIYSGRNWSTLKTIQGSLSQPCVIHTSAADDEWLLGSIVMETETQTLSLRSLRADVPRYAIPLSSNGTTFIHAVGDIDGDGSDDVIVSAIHYEGVGAVEMICHIGK